MKKLTAILLALMLIISITPAVFATVYTEGYFYYTISDESITITGYFGDEETVTVPAMIAGIPVNTIASGAFAGSGIKVLNLPDTITSIEAGAVDDGVVIHYNSNLPSGGQEPQPDPTQPDPSQPDSPPETEDNTEPQQPPQDESHPTNPSQPTQPTNPSQPTNPAQPTNPTQPAKPTQPSKPTQPTQPTQTEPPAVTTSTEPTIEDEEVEAEFAFDDTEPVTTSPAEDIPDSTKETEAATEPSEPKPFGAVIAVAAAAVVLAMGAFLVWKKKK